MHILNQKEAWEVCSQWPLLLGLYFLIDIIQVCWLIFSGDTSNQAESHPSVDRVPNLGRNTCNAVTRILGRHVPWWNKWHDVAMYVLWQLATKSCKTGCYKWNNFKKRNCLAGFQPLSILFNIISYKDSFKGLRAQEIASRNISNRLQSFGYQLRITNMVYPVSYWNLSSVHCRYVYHIYIYISYYHILFLSLIKLLSFLFGVVWERQMTLSKYGVEELALVFISSSLKIRNRNHSWMVCTSRLWLWVPWVMELLHQARMPGREKKSRENWKLQMLKTWNSKFFGQSHVCRWLMCPMLFVSVVSVGSIAGLSNLSYSLFLGESHPLNRRTFTFHSVL